MSHNNHTRYCGYGMRHQTFDHSNIYDVSVNMGYRGNMRDVNSKEKRASRGK
jgi:hypothetical protein